MFQVNSRHVASCSIFNRMPSSFQAFGKMKKTTLPLVYCYWACSESLLYRKESNATSQVTKTHASFLDSKKGIPESFGISLASCPQPIPLTQKWLQVKHIFMLFHFKVFQNEVLKLKPTLSRIFIPALQYFIYLAIQVRRNLVRTVNFA